MCGISGAISYGNRTISFSKLFLERMVNTEFMTLRGPDGKGVWLADDKTIGLGHSRLSILDLSTSANQPMCNEDNSIIIVYNGEVYNYAEIKEEIKDKYTWKTDHSDTEVLLHAYEEWGIDCIHKFRGMFAIALWDSRKEVLYLVRDRLGVKPLYYAIYDGKLTFSSDINAILEDDQFKREVNDESLSSYFCFLSVPAPNTLFKNIFKLEAGTYLEIKKDGVFKKIRYWDMLEASKKYEDKNKGKDEKELIEELRNIMAESVAMRKISDVPVGVFLSGGIDSSTNAMLFSENGKEKIKTFTVKYEGNLKNYRNEDGQAQKLANLIGAEHHVVSVKSNDVFRVFPWLIKMMGEPIADPVSAPQYFVAKEARDNNVIVCQIGEGVDELYAGYPRWLKMHKMSKIAKIRLPIFIKKTILNIVGKIRGTDSNIYDSLERYCYNLPTFWSTNAMFTRTERSLMLNKKEKAKDDPAWKCVEPYYEAFKVRSDGEVINWMTYVDLNIRMSDLLLPKVDKMCMATSVESRVPFLDPEFVAFAISLPEKLKYSNKETKVFLKKAVRGIIPDEIIDRKKAGFALPLDDWYGENIFERMRCEIDYFLDHTHFLNKEGVHCILNKKRPYQLWMLYTLAIWWKMFIENK